MRTLRVAAVFAALLAGVSCAPAASRGDFDSPNPAAKLYAIERAAREGNADPQTLGRIVEQLDSDDAAVRLMAITTLERLTGETLGYRHFDPPPQRRAAIRAWVEYLEGGTETEQAGPASDAGDQGERERERQDGERHG